MKLPNGERADLGTNLKDDILNPLHQEGRHKARVFASALGITLTNRNVLRQAILTTAAVSDRVEAGGDNGHGEVYVLRFPLETAEGRATMLTVLIVRHGEDFARLTTCYIVQEMQARLPLHTVVALLEDTRSTRFESGEPLLLRRGQIGTAVITYEDGACEVEFADRGGRAYAMLTLSADQMMVLHDTPEHAAV